MSKKLITGALIEWNYISGITRKAVEAFPDDRWDFSPSPEFGSFAKQLRHVICCRGVFADSFVSRTVDFGKKQSFYSAGLSKTELLAALDDSTEKTCAVLESLAEQDLDGFRSEYYGEKMTFIEHFSATTCHEAKHCGMWAVYAAVLKDGK